MYKRKGELNFVLIGAKSTGKTQYVKYLSSRPEISAASEGTVGYIESLREDKATNISLTELYFNYRDNKYTVDFQIDDYDGNFVETWHTSENSDYKEKLTEYLKESEGIFLFLPYETIDTDTKFNSMKREIDTFIKKIKEEYGEEHAQLPIPIVICVTKWDKSSHFRVKDENEKAIEYINSNETLKLIKDKVSLHFKSVEIIPLSSQQNHNITLPIRLCLDNTFQYWEDEITSLQNNHQKEELLKLLASIMYDLRFYKNGIYKALYEKVESEVSPSYLSDIESISSLSKLNKYYEENIDILESFTPEHQELISKKRDSVKLKSKIVKTIIALFVIGSLLTAIFAYNIYAKKQTEIKQYNNIKTELSNKNYRAVMLSIKNYYKNSNDINKQHVREIKDIEENTKAIFRKKIEEQMAIISKSPSIIKKDSMMKKVYLLSQDYGLNEAIMVAKYNSIKKLKNTYETTFEEINKLSLEAIDQKKIESIRTKLNILSTYSESQKLQKLFDKKLSSITALVSDLDDETTIDKMISLSASINIPEEVTAQLRKKKAYFTLRDEFKEFKKALENYDKLDEAINYLNTNWNSKWTDNDKKKIVQIINDKFNTIVYQKLQSFTKDRVNSIDDLQIIRESNNNIIILKKILQSSEVKLNTNLNEENLKGFNRQKELLDRYNKVLKSGVTIGSFTFYAPKKNELGFDCGNSEKLHIGNGTYQLYDSHYIDGECEEKDQGYSVTYKNAILYTSQTINLHFTIHNLIFSDKKQGGVLEITPNKLIKLENGEKLSFDIGSSYKVTLKK